ncbi:MAG: hypothetical protein KDD70_08275 [Bdellovibrionales bacterium]|nr:hypothetical protein [Bdellovibrionales bacterium]
MLFYCEGVLEPKVEARDAQIVPNQESSVQLRELPTPEMVSEIVGAIAAMPVEQRLGAAVSTLRSALYLLEPESYTLLAQAEGRRVEDAPVPALSATQAVTVADLIEKVTEMVSVGSDGEIGSHLGRASSGLVQLAGDLIRWDDLRRPDKTKLAANVRELQSVVNALRISEAGEVGVLGFGAQSA